MKHCSTSFFKIHLSNHPPKATEAITFLQTFTVNAPSDNLRKFKEIEIPLNPITFTTPDEETDAKKIKESI